ncbi:DegV family protein [Paenibacillus thiaminolyticus]|uniref:DegV family protein n=1 Tax=Paenibacillus thiaminolyticus TaxID=49283 RepID=A0AAP9DZM9_PANTH|nr:DegV family protein [Paenibacillus thiaminolyticus]MCY9537091.1 DegV family protein [Paenibacillus thiaminolyticus]MCY9603150.1 DegV family protein [Paenibacillus thiaminolyticus]MCY9607980.1 DegV family protein [Paenibacillus thiaminolyticus]MCY9613597.1 DegV family protein [Paenibacillus thiaminolyticus]MCY9618759.1 DegV family protein [Paenibacillus thiaminolyticus]
MNQVRILTDSAIDLPPSVLEELNITVLPIIVTLDQNQYEDGVTIQPKQMFDGMRQGLVYKTSQVPMERFQQTFTAIAEAGEDAIYIAFSSELSGTYASSRMMLDMVKDDYPDAAIDIIDSKCASMGFGLVVEQAARWAADGMSRERLVSKVRALAAELEHVFTVDDLEYLYRGGRVSKSSAVIGGLLNIKPVLHVEEGKLIPVDKVRGRKKSIQRLADLMEQRANLEDKDQLIGIAHGDDTEAMEMLKQIINERFGMHNIMTGSIGCAIGAHSGPGTLALFFRSRNYTEAD